MKTLIMLVSLAIAVAIGYWLYEALSDAGDIPVDIIDEVKENVKNAGEKVVTVAEDAGRVLSGKATVNGKNLGESCVVGTDCKGYAGVAEKGVACCASTCTKLVKDYLGTYWCPSECKSGIFAKKGSC
jgi:hypothetical protein